MRRVKELDSIRGLAALSILAYHLWFLNIALFGTAVDLFFVLSGYLITTIILDNQMTERFIVTFYIRRSLRIWPIYYLSLFALVALNPLLPTPGSLDGLPYYLTYTQKITSYWFGHEPAFIPAFRHTWTLAIEEQFYLIWPALIFVLGRRWLAPLSLSLILAALVARSVGFNPWILLTHSDGLALGGLLAGLLNDRDRVREHPAAWRLAFGLIAVGATGIALLGGPLFRAVGCPTATHASVKMLALNLVFFAMVGLIVVDAGRPWLGWLRDRRLAYLGQISYGLYLYHHIAYFLWDDFATHHGFAGAPWLDVAKLATTFGVAALSWQYIEQPILMLKDRFTYRASPTPVRVDMPELASLGTIK
jgi:peptidoglycan/LPS O-acetylase OafA/YrhL